MEPATGFEPATVRLQIECSTTELCWPQRQKQTTTLSELSQQQNSSFAF